MNESQTLFSVASNGIGLGFGLVSAIQWGMKSGCGSLGGEKRSRAGLVTGLLLSQADSSRLAWLDLVSLRS